MKFHKSGRRFLLDLPHSLCMNDLEENNYGEVLSRLLPTYGQSWYNNCIKINRLIGAISIYLSIYLHPVDSFLNSLVIPLILKIVSCNLLSFDLIIFHAILPLGKVNTLLVFQQDRRGRKYHEVGAVDDLYSSPVSSDNSL
jgi:hypothetical protein